MKKRLSEKTQMKVAVIVGVAIILLVAILLVAVLQYVLLQTQKHAKIMIEETPILWVMIFALTSIIIGLTLAFIFSKVISRPFNNLIEGITKLSEGEFDTRIDLGKVGNIGGVKSLSDKFNALAAELQKTEILRSDFVNNFSHELKTPIVSVSSLISLLKNESLPKEKKLQYMNIIEEEINRLTDMTTNILNLSKIENQGILTDKTEYNLSEQIRSSVLLLEKKWVRKNLTLNMDFDEYVIKANEDLLKQVWVNLLDNAIKFSDEDGEFGVDITKNGEKIEVIVFNIGESIPESDYVNIFQKFYQCDHARTKQGNGIGLSIVKHIVDLHEGQIQVESKGGKTSFTVILPIGR